MSIYDEALATATALLKELGQPVTLTRVTVGTYNPATSSASSTTVNQTTSGVLLEIDLAQIDQTLIKTGDKRLLMSASGISQPQLDDSVAVNGRTYTIKHIKELNPAGTAVLYDCLVRR